MRVASKLKLINQRETGLEPTLGKVWNGKRILSI